MSGIVVDVRGLRVTTEAVPAVAGWFEDGASPRLIGQGCSVCGTTIFPPTASTCPNPACRGDELEAKPLSASGRVWSWATNHYEPPPPYMAPEPFEPYTVVAVDLDDEGLTVLGQLSAGVDPTQLHVGARVTTTVETLFHDEDGTPRTVWRFRPDPQEAS